MIWRKRVLSVFPFSSPFTPGWDLHLPFLPVTLICLPVACGTLTLSQAKVQMTAVDDLVALGLGARPASK